MLLISYLIDLISMFHCYASVWCVNGKIFMEIWLIFHFYDFYFLVCGWDVQNYSFDIWTKNIMM